jgi:hypothetical protein
MKRTCRWVERYRGRYSREMCYGDAWKGLVMMIIAGGLVSADGSIGFAKDNDEVEHGAFAIEGQESGLTIRN